MTGCPEGLVTAHPPTPLVLHLWLVAGIATVVSVFMSFRLIHLHLCHYVAPNYQKHVARILLMVPIYAISSFFSLRYYTSAPFINVARDMYEGFVVYSFFKLCLEYLGPNQEVRELILSSKQPRQLPPPVCCFMHDPSHFSFLNWCGMGIIQYVFVRIITSFLGIFLESYHLYCISSISPHYGHFWTTIMLAISVGLAMFTLAALYLTIRTDINEFKPVGQFFSIKFVIFFSFWQGFAIKYLLDNEVISDIQEASAFQNFLTCVEMVIASILLAYTFNYHIFQSSIILEPRSDSTALLTSRMVGCEPLPYSQAFWNAFSWLDFYRDGIFVVGSMRSLLSRRPSDFRAYQPGSPDGSPYARPIVRLSDSSTTTSSSSLSRINSHVSAN